MKRCLHCLFALTIAFTAVIAAQDKFEFWLGTQYDGSVPTFKQVLGYDPGERIASHAEIMKYFDALERAKPGQIKIFEYARSWEGKKLIYAAVGSEANIARLTQLGERMRRLADPRVTGDSEARQIISDLPAFTWLPSRPGQCPPGEESAPATPCRYLLDADSEPAP